MKTNIKDFPDLGNSMKLLKISVELEGVTGGGIIGMAIQNSLRNDRLNNTLKMIREMARDNFKMMQGIIGEDLLNDILTVTVKI